MNLERDTLHDFSIEIVRTMAEVFGLRVDITPAGKAGPDLIIKHPHGGDYDVVMYVESEIGHDAGGAEAYFDKVANRLRPLIFEDKARSRHMAIAIVTNAPRRLSVYLKEKGSTLADKLGFDPIEGWNIYIVPVVLFREILPTVMIRTFGTVGRVV